MVGIVPAGRLPTGDAPHLLGMAHRFANALVSGDLSGFAALISGQVTPHPPVGYLLPSLGYALGLSSLVPLATSLVALGLVWHGMGLLVREPGQKARPPWVGGMLLLCSGMTWFVVEQVAWDLLGAGLVVALVGHAWASQGLSKPRHAVAVGVIAGLGCMTKYTFPVFVLLPSLVVGLHALRTRQWRGLALTLVAFAVLAGPWLTENMGAILAYVASSSDPSRTISDSPAAAWSDRMQLETLLYYPAVLRDAWGWPGLFLVLLSLPAVWHPGCRLALLGGVGGIVALTFAGEQQARYVYPALPLLAAMVDVAMNARWAERTAHRWRWLGTLVVLPALWGAFAMSWVHRTAPPTRNLAPGPLVNWGSWPWPAESLRPTSLGIEAYAVDQVVQQLAQGLPAGEHTVGIELPRNPGAPSASAYMWRAEQQGHSWTWAMVTRVGPAGRPTLFLTPSTSTVDTRSRRFSVAYVVRSPGAVPGPVERMAATAEFIHQLPGDRVGRIVTVPADAWQTPTGRRLLRDPMLQ